jgi:CheY-like chemotaxis protein
MCFIELPLELCIQPAILRQAEPEAMIEEQITFLLIDDVRMNRTMFRRRINKGIAPNAVITEASTGEEALEICKNNKFDIIIVDQHMEEAGGLLLGTDTVVALRQSKIESFIIGCSGNDMEDQFIGAGSDWSIGKPTPTNKVILKQLRGFLTKRRHTDNLIGEQLILLAKKVAGSFEHPPGRYSQNRKFDQGRELRSDDSGRLSSRQDSPH